MNVCPAQFCTHTCDLPPGHDTDHRCDCGTTWPAPPRHGTPVF